MQSNQVWKYCLGAAGLNSLAAAISHFLLPVIFDWDAKLADVHPIFPWALGVFNFSWSLMLLLMGVVVLHIAWRGPAHTALERLIVLGLGAFWLIHGIHLFVYTNPLPPDLAWLNGALLPFPIIVSSLHFIPIWSTRKRAPE